jgi:hypothetical protein
MSPLLAPVFAQILTLQVGDRTEARYIDYEDQATEGSTNPRADLSLGWGRSDLSIGYGPSFTLSPLDEKPRQLLVFHDAGASAGYRFKRSYVSLSSSLGWGEINFRLAPLRGPGAPDTDAADDAAPDGADADPDADPALPQPPDTAPPDAPEPAQPGLNDPSAGQLSIIDATVRYYTSTTTLTLTHDLTRAVALGAQAGYVRAGGMDEESRVYYSVQSGWFVGASGDYTYRLTSRDALVSSASLVHFWSSNGNKTASLSAQETWQHVFGPRTSGALGAGLNITRFSQADGLRGFSVFPTFQASLGHEISLGRAGTLGLGLFAYSAPALDPLRALVDPRVGFGAGISYARKRFSLSLNGATALSLAPSDHDAGAIDSIQGDARAAYRIADMIEVDAGARYVRQQVQDVTVLPSSWSAYVGVNAGYLMRLYGKRR